MFDWCEATAEAVTLSCLVMEGETGARRALEERGHAAERPAAAHRAGWSDLGSRVTTRSYAKVMALLALPVLHAFRDLG